MIIHEAYILVRLLYDYPFPRYNMYKVVENRKCIERPQTESERLADKSTIYMIYTLNTYPCRRSSVFFFKFCSHRVPC